MRFLSQQEKSRGFTVIEVIAAVLLLAILSVVVVSRFFPGGYSVPLQVERMKLHLRYAQTNSMNTDQIWAIVFQGNNYFLVRGGDTANPVLLPGEDILRIPLPSGFTLNQTVAFDNWGRPSTSLTASPLATTDLVINIPGHPVTITRNTGFIP